MFWSFTFRKHEKSVANLWERDIGCEIMRRTTKSWNLASLNLMFKFYLCYIQQLSYHSLVRETCLATHVFYLNISLDL